MIENPNSAKIKKLKSKINELEKGLNRYKRKLINQ